MILHPLLLPLKLIKSIKLKEKAGTPKEPHIAFQGSALVGHEIIYLPPKSR
jgi:hypothetical protein